MNVIFITILHLQSNDRDKIELLDDPNEKTFDNIAKMFGLQKIGWIFTDLIADSSGKGTVKQVRGNVVSCNLNIIIYYDYINYCKNLNRYQFILDILLCSVTNLF